MDVKNKKTANQKETQQTSQKKRTATKNMQTKGHAAEMILVSSSNAQEAQQKADKTHETSQNNRSKKTANMSNKNTNMQLSFKKPKK